MSIIAYSHLPDTPYQGLMPYFEEDWLYFFGREADTEIITANLMASRLTVLYGASGVGKSSVLRAGVAHRLRCAAQENLAENGMPEFAIVLFNFWRDDPLAALADRVLLSVEKALGGQSLEPLPSSISFSQTLQLYAEQVGGELFILLDQFEEYFLYHSPWEAEGTFAVEFARAVNNPDIRASFLISIRDESLAKLDCFKGRISTLFDNYLRIEHLDLEAARAAIEMPVERYNEQYSLLHETNEQTFRVEPALVEAILERIEVPADSGYRAKRSDLARTRFEAPLLQIVMERLWKEEVDNGSYTLRLSTLERLGMGEGIVRDHLDAAMNKFSEEKKYIAACAFFHLVTRTGTKIAHNVPDLADLTKLSQGELSPVLKNLSSQDTRILRAVAPPPGEPHMQSYEVFHDVLAIAVRDWRTRYDQARERAEAEQQASSEAARKAKEAADIRERKRLRMFLIIASLLAALFFILGITFAVLSQQAAIRNIANFSARQLAIYADRNLDVDPQLSLLLADRAVDSTYRRYKTVTKEAEAALHRAIQASFIPKALTGHSAAVNDVAYSPTGRRLATASTDGTAKIWDVVSGSEVLTLSGHTGAVNGVAYSPDGKRLATISADGTAKVWDVVSGEELLILTGHKSAINGVAFSPDGTRLATACTDGIVKIWNAASGTELRTLVEQSDLIQDLIFSPGGKRLATASADGAAKVWDPATGEEMLTLIGDTVALNGIVYSPDGTRLAAAGADGTAKVWDIVSGREVLSFTGHTGTINSIAYSPNGKHLATASADGTAKVWSTVSGREVLTLNGHAGALLSVAYSPDGTRVAITSAEGIVRVTDATSDLSGFFPVIANVTNNTAYNLLWLNPSDHADAVNGIGYSPDGVRLATASADGTAKVWDAASGGEVLTLTGHSGAINGVVYNHDGARLATASSDGTARVWDAVTGGEVLTLTGHSDAVNAVAYNSQDGTRLATASADGTAKVWDAVSGREVLTLTGHTGAITSVAYSPDGTHLATASADGTAKVWDAASGGEVLTLTGHSGAINGVVYNHDGARLATASSDGTARVWDAVTGGEVLTLSGHSGAVNSVTFSLDGRSLVTTSADKTVQVCVWEKPTSSYDNELFTLSGHTGAVHEAVFSPDGKYLVTISTDRTARKYVLDIETLRALAQQRMTRDLTPEEYQKYLTQDWSRLWF